MVFRFVIEKELTVDIGHGFLMDDYYFAKPVASDGAASDAVDGAR